MLSKSIATSTVKEISKLVNKHINMMNVDGIIIASSNPERIGQAHWGAEKIIAENLDELYITNDDISDIQIASDQFVQTGLNLPLIIHGETVGVIGITGEYNEVSQIGYIIKKMAEILLEDQIKNQQLAANKWKFESFINNYLNTRSFNFSKSLSLKAKELKFDLNKYYFIAIIKIADSTTTLSEIGYRQEIANYLQNQISYLINKSIIVQKENHWLILIPEDYTSEDKIENKLSYFVKALSDKVYQEYSLKIRFGISSLIDNKISPFENLEQAEFALFYSDMNQKPLTFYDDLGIANIIFYFPENVKKGFLTEFYKDISEQDIEDYIELFKAYFNYEGSITEIAESMFIHSNTVQYRLNKFSKLTGKDIRKASQSHLFYIAILLEKEKIYRQKLAQNTFSFID
ncbi:MAG: CdaR family transcriptional regulator [Saccharofermentanales bacterium]|jgi:carbohydrate diacid regulator